LGNFGAAPCPRGTAVPKEGRYSLGFPRGKIASSRQGRDGTVSLTESWGLLQGLFALSFLGCRVVVGPLLAYNAFICPTSHIVVKV